MRVELKNVTPALAREWLALNTENRSVRKGVVSRYAADMRAGNWVVNGAPIVLNGAKLIDGQHRLMAIVESGISIDSVVVFDAPSDAMDTIDQGVSRKLSDVLTIRHVPDASTVAAAINQGWKWEKGSMLGAGGEDRPTIAQALDWLDRNPRITSAARFMKRLAGAPVKLRTSVGAPIYMRASDWNAERATEFFDRLYDGEHLSGGDPVYALRRHLIRNATSVHHKMHSSSMAALTIKAWNYWVMGDRIELLRWGRGGTGLEAFPVMVNDEGNPLPGQGIKEDSLRSAAA